MKQTIEIPEGKEAKWVNGVLTLVNKPHLKKGDFVSFNYVHEKNRCLGIIGEFYEMYSPSTNMRVVMHVNEYLRFNEVLTLHSPKLATKEEKQQILSSLAKAGKKWNAEKLCIVEDIEYKLPKTWEESMGKSYTSGYYIDVDSRIKFFDSGTSCDKNKNFFHTKEQANAMLAFIQLIWLRDIYRQGWVPNWESSNPDKHIIYFLGGEISKDFNFREQRVLSFQSEEIRDLFLKNFKDLIEQAKAFI